MKIKATNPYSQTENPVSWHGWQCGFWSEPNTEVSQTEIAACGEAFKTAFYRGQGAQIIRELPLKIVTLKIESSTRLVDRSLLRHCVVLLGAYRSALLEQLPSNSSLAARVNDIKETLSYLEGQL